MRYYIVGLNENEKHVPAVTNWYETIPVTAFFQGRTWEVPFRNLLFVKDTGEEPRYLKLLFSPFPLVHESVLSVFHAYGLKGIQKQMVLLDIRYKKAELYYLLQLFTVRTRVNRESGKPWIVCGQREIAGRDAFYIMEERRCLLVLSLALAESLARQGVAGMRLEAIEIREENTNG